MEVVLESGGGGGIEVQEMNSMERVEEALFSNLVLLGLSSEWAEKKYGCSIEREMFRASNSKGLEVVLYYLLSRVSEEAKDAFRVIWPISDQKQAREFRRVANQTLQKLERDNHLPSGTFRVSHLTSASGERLCIMLWHLSTYAMKVVMAEEMKNADFHSISRLLPPISSTSSIPSLETIKHATGLRISQQVNRFVSMAEQERQEEATRHELAFSLQQEYRIQSKRKLSLAQQAKELDSHGINTLPHAHGPQKSLSSEIELSADPSLLLIPSQVEEAWNMVVQHLDQWQLSGEVLERVIEKRANSTLLDAKPLGTPSHRNESRELDLTRMVHDWNGQLERVHARLVEIKASDEKFKRRELTRQSEKLVQSGKQRLNQGNKENVTGQGHTSQIGESGLALTRLQDVARKLEQLALQHDQQVGVMRGVMEGMAKTEMVQMRDMIESLSKSISNSNASSKMESQLRSLLSMDDMERAKEEDLCFPRSEHPQSVSKLALTHPIARGTPSKIGSSVDGKGSMGLLIPPTPRMRGSSAIPPTPSLLNSVQSGHISANRLESPMTQSLSNLPSPALGSQFRSLSTPSIDLSDTPRRTLSANSHIGTQGKSGKANFRRIYPDAFSGSSGTQTPSTLARNRSTVASSWMNDFNEALLVQELTHAISSASGELTAAHSATTTLTSPLALNLSSHSADERMLKSKGRESVNNSLHMARSTASSPSQSATPRSVSSGRRGRSGRSGSSQEKQEKRFSLESPSNALFGSPFALHSQQASMNFSPLYQTSTPLSAVGNSLRSSSTPRSRASGLRISSLNASSSVLAVSYGQGSELVGLQSQVSSPSSLMGLPALRAGSPSPKEVERRQSIIMEELAEQIIDIMGSAGLDSQNLSPSDLTKHTMAILGIKSPRMSIRSAQETPSKLVSDASRAVEAFQIDSTIPASMATHATSSSTNRLSIGVINTNGSRRSSSSRSGSKNMSSSYSSISLHGTSSSSHQMHQRASSASAEERISLAGNSRMAKHATSQNRSSYSNGFALAEMTTNRRNGSSFGSMDEGSHFGEDSFQTLGEHNQSLGTGEEEEYGQLDDDCDTMSIRSDEFDDMNGMIDSETFGDDEILAEMAIATRGNSVGEIQRNRPFVAPMGAKHALLLGDDVPSNLDISVSLLEAQLAEIEADEDENGDFDDNELQATLEMAEIDARKEGDVNEEHEEGEEWDDDEQDELERELQRLALEEALEKQTALEMGDDEDVYDHAGDEGEESEWMAEDEEENQIAPFETESVSASIVNEDKVDCDVFQSIEKEEHDSQLVESEMTSFPPNASFPVLDASVKDFPVESEVNQSNDDMPLILPSKIGNGWSGEVKEKKFGVLGSSGLISVTASTEPQKSFNLDSFLLGECENDPLMMVESQLTTEGAKKSEITSKSPFSVSSASASTSSFSTLVMDDENPINPSDMSQKEEEDALLSLLPISPSAGMADLDFDMDGSFMLDNIEILLGQDANVLGDGEESGELIEMESNEFDDFGLPLVLSKPSPRETFLNTEAHNNLEEMTFEDAKYLGLEPSFVIPSSIASSSSSKPVSLPQPKSNGKQRLNLSINPDDDAQNDPFSISPGFDRIKKVLDFAS